MIISAAGSNLSAETIFLKDGKVLIDFAITKEDDSSVHIQKGAETRTVSRAEILRINYGEFNQNKVFVYLKDGSEEQLFLVSEDQFTYTFRSELESPIERQIPKKKIKIVSEEKVEKTVIVQKTRNGALYRSALLPGLGQYYKGQTQRAYIYWGAFGSAVIATAWLGLNYASDQAAYQELGEGSTDFDSAFAQAQVSAERFNLALGVVGLIYLVNLADIWFGGELDEGAGGFSHQGGGDSQSRGRFGGRLYTTAIMPPVAGGYGYSRRQDVQVRYSYFF